MHTVIRRVMLVTIVPLALAAVSAGAQGAAQRTKGYLEASAFRATMSGREFATPNLKPAFGFELGVVISNDDQVHLGGGVQYASHASGPDTESLGVLQFFLEPRFALLTSGRWIPYVGARLGYVRTSQKLFLFDDVGVEIPGQGVQGGQSYGGTVGVLYKASHNVRTFVSMTFQKLSLGNLAFDEQPIPASKVKGESTIIRAGVSFDFSLPDRAQFLPRR